MPLASNFRPGNIWILYREGTIPAYSHCVYPSSCSLALSYLCRVLKCFPQDPLHWRGWWRMLVLPSSGLFWGWWPRVGSRYAFRSRHWLSCLSCCISASRDFPTHPLLVACPSTWHILWQGRVWRPITSLNLGKSPSTGLQQRTPT